MSNTQYPLLVAIKSRRQEKVISVVGNENNLPFGTPFIVIKTNATQQDYDFACKIQNALNKL